MFRHTLRLRRPLRVPSIRTFHSSPFHNSKTHLLPEFSLKDKVIAVSGGARGLGLVQIEALLEAGAHG